MKRFLTLSLVGVYALNCSIAFSAANGGSNGNAASSSSSSSSNSGTNSTGGAGAVSNSSSNVGNGNSGNGIGNSGSGNTGTNGTSTGNASGTTGSVSSSTSTSTSSTGSIPSSTSSSSTSSSTGGVQGGSTGGAGAVSNTNSNVGNGNSGNGIGNVGSGNLGNESSTGNAGGSIGSTTSSTSTSSTGSIPSSTSSSSSTGGVQGGSTGGAGAVANTNSNVGNGNNGNGIGNSGSGNLGNESSTGNAGGSIGSTTSSTSTSSNGDLVPVTTSSSSSSNNGGVQGGSTGGAGAVSNTNSNVGNGNNGTGIGNSGSGNQGNESSTGNAGGSNGSTNSSSSSTGGVQGGDTGGAGAVANTNSNVGNGNNGTGIGNSGSGNQGNETSTGNAGGTNDTTTTNGSTNGDQTSTNGDQTSTNGDQTSTNGDQSSTNGDQSSNGGDQTTTNGGSTGEDQNRIGLRVNFVPMIYADFVKTRSVINLTPASNLNSYLYSLDRALQSYQGTGCEVQQEIPMQAQCVGFDFDRPLSLELDNYSAGFKVVDYYDFTIGAGEATSFTLTNVSAVGALFNASAGLMPVGGKSLRIERFVKNEKDTVQSQTELKRAKFPYTVESLYKNFNVGDNAEVTSTGGLLAFASAGYSAFQLGVSYLFTGTWKTSVELVDDKTAFVKVSKVKVNTIAGSAGVGVVTVAIAHFRNMDDSFSFMLDLSKKKNVAIYQDLVRGHLVPAQQAALKSASGVQIVSAYKAKTLGRKKVAYVGLPIFINKTWQKGVAETSVESLEKDGKNYLIHIGSFFNNSAYRRINKTDDKVETFIGQIVEEKGSYKKYLSAQFAWGFSTTDLWMPRMNYELNKFYKFSGLRNTFGVVIPNVKDLGNLTASVQLDIPHEGIMHLMNLPKGTLVANGSLVLDSYFSNGDESGLCVAHPTSRVCRAVWRKKTENSLEKAEGILEDMRSERDADKFAKDFAYLGQEMLDNQFAFQAILKSTCTPASFNVTVEGKRVSRVVKNTVIANLCY